MSGKHTAELGGGRYYAMARNLAYELRAAYDAALAEFDVLVIHTHYFAHVLCACSSYLSYNG